MPEFTIRPYDGSGERNSLETAFRVYLPRKNLAELGLVIGDLCSVGDSNGVPNLGIAWLDPKTNANNSKPLAKVTDFFREIYSLSYQDKVTIEKCKDTRKYAESIQIESYVSHRGSLLEDFPDLDHAKFRILAALGRSWKQQYIQMST